MADSMETGTDGGRGTGKSGASTPGEFSLDNHLFYWMTKVMGRRDRQLADELRRFGLRVTGWRLLALLKDRRRASIGEAATDAGVDHTTMSRIADRMVRDKLLSKVADTSDMRITRVALTPAGEQLFQEIWPVVARLNCEALARLPEGSVPLLCLALGTVCQTMEESWITAAPRKRASGPV